MNDKVIIALQNLLSSDGWQVLQKELLKEVQVIEQQLFTVSDNEMIYTSQDVNRLVRNHVLDLTTLPNKLLEQYKGSITTDATENTLS